MELEGKAGKRKRRAGLTARARRVRLEGFAAVAKRITAGRVTLVGCREQDRRVGELATADC